MNKVLEEKLIKAPKISCWTMDEEPDFLELDCFENEILILQKESSVKKCYSTEIENIFRLENKLSIN